MHFLLGETFAIKTITNPAFSIYAGLKVGWDREEEERPNVVLDSFSKVTGTLLRVGHKGKLPLCWNF